MSNNLPIILGIDTSLGSSSVSLCTGDKEIGCRISENVGKQAISLISNIEDILKNNNLWYQDINGIAVSIGPGGFSGIRVGLSAARALSYAAKKPIIGFSSLEILLSSCEKKCSEDCLIILPAGRGKYFIQYKKDMKMILEEELLYYTMKAKIIITTIDNLDLPNNNVNNNIKIYDAKTGAYSLCQLANNSGFNKDDPLPSPLYIRPVDAKIQKKFFR